MESIFRHDWNELAAEDVEAFLSDAGDEGLTWEAKGGDQAPHPGSIHKAVCGLANRLGGYLIIGAEQDDDRGWSLPGASFDVDEPGTWLSTVISSGFSVAPETDVRTWGRAEDRHAAVVQVEPIAAPPCITRGGAVYQRVSGATEPITDQAVLAQLFARGDAARAEAEAVATRAAKRMIAEAQFFTRQQYSDVETAFALAIAAVGSPADKARQLFRPSVLDHWNQVVGGLILEPGIRFSSTPAVLQEGIWATQLSHEYGSCWFGAAFWDGSVVLAYANQTEYVGDLMLEERLKLAWEAIAEFLPDLRAYGPAHLIALINTNHAAINPPQHQPRDIEIRQWTAVRPPTDDEVGALTRELDRAFGRSVLEPEEDEEE